MVGLWRKIAGLASLNHILTLEASRSFVRHIISLPLSSAAAYATLFSSLPAMRLTWPPKKLQPQAPEASLSFIRCNTHSNSLDQTKVAAANNWAYSRTLGDAAWRKKQPPSAVANHNYRRLLTVRSIKTLILNEASAGRLKTAEPFKIWIIHHH